MVMNSFGQSTGQWTFCGQIPLERIKCEITEKRASCVFSILSAWVAPWKFPSVYYIYRDYKIKHACISGNPESAGVHFTDQTVCRAFMTGLCPHTLFTNTVSIDIEYLGFCCSFTHLFSYKISKNSPYMMKKNFAIVQMNWVYLTLCLT